jgi:sugar O-acyltransferase (sialic acid O-acetyltransferase NeuD family)
MKDKIVVIGGGEHARVIINVIKKLDEYEILGYTDLLDKGLLQGIKYLGNDEVLKDVFIKYTDCKAVIGVGLIKVSNVRNRIYGMLKNIGFNLPTIISKNAIMYEDVTFGEGTVVLDNAIVNSNSTIGKCGLVYSSAIIEHDCKVGDFVTFATGSILAAGSKIGNNSILSVGAIVVSHKSICNNCFIGAGSVAIKDILIEGDYFGVPARRINI